jgi:ribosomal protein L7/L12
MSTTQSFWDALFHRSSDARLQRVEAKVDVILGALGVSYKDVETASLSEEVKALADQPRKKFAAVKLHRAQTGAGLREAEAAVAAHIRARRSSRRKSVQAATTRS